jgi:SAM-dependent methyltransferase
VSAYGSDWGGGYVTDLPYLPGYYRHQSPLHLNLACLLGGVAALELHPGKALSYLELGCGHGFGALALATSNPAWQVTGIDFSPAHIGSARALAAAAGIANARFVEADLATLADTPRLGEVPEADVASLHGLWSWVPDAVREGIVRLLATKVRPGGVVQISYNALPAWQSALGMQRLLREAGERVPARSDCQVVAGLEIVSSLAEAKAHHLHGLPFVASLLEHSRHCQTAYLAHEYMCETWRPCFHADVVAALSAAKLDWVASANLLENFSPLMLPEEARTIRDRFDDPIIRELIKDLCLPRGLRQDVFVRGARKIVPADRDAALEEVVLGLLCPPAEFAWEIELPSGKATLEGGFFGPIVAALARGPQSVRDLLRLPDLPRHDNPSEVIGMLVGTEQAIPMLAPPGEPDPRVRRFNQMAASAFVRSENLNTGMALAASGTGSPVPCTMLDLFVAARQDEKQQSPDTVGWAETLGIGRPEEEHRRLAAFIDRLVADRAPIWRMLGGLGACASSAC